MKSKVFKFSGLLVGVLIFLAIFGVNPIIARASEELYFDSDGNLYYITREKKATGSVKYYTIGWIIKRYDMPIDVPGQQYVIVTKNNYKPDMVDPDDSRYVYCYYKSDKEEILNAVISVSGEWYFSLVNYGDTVYIDSVMTVLQKGEQQGFLYEGGAYTGEVYFDYEGIAGARSWASPESLRVNFGMSVEFPALYKSMATYISLYQEDIKYLSSSLFSSASNGSSDYDVTKGIPSGEDMYVKSSVSKGIYNITLRQITGEMTIGVQVPVTYILKWTDYYGVKREETKVVNRYYTVMRPFSYYQYEGCTEKKLVGIELDSTLFGGIKKVAVDIQNSKGIDSGSIKYDGLDSHMLGYEISKNVKIEPIVLTSNTYLKPSIPFANYIEEAEKMVSQIKVRSDKVVIDGKTILSDEIKRGDAHTPVSSFTVTNVSVQDNELIIGKNIKNGAGYSISGKYLFKDSNGKIYTYNMTGLKSVVVHTPVVCNIGTISDKTLNQAVEPTSVDVVLGSSVKITFNDFGLHRNIKGYGTRSYNSYVKKRQVRCGFDVVYKGMTYEAGTWIDTKDYYLDLSVCENNREGVYTIETRTVAYNASDNCGSELFEDGANLSIGKYGASHTKEVRLIGRIEGLKLEVNDEIQYPKEMPYNLRLDSDKENESNYYTLKIETVGDIGKTDYVEAHYSYYIKDENGEFIPVWVYEVEGRDIVNGERLDKLGETETWGQEYLILDGNKGVWQRKIEVPSEYVVVKEGVTEENIKQGIKDGSLDETLIKGESLYVAVEFVRYKDGQPYISYINQENAKRGYCNMWTREGGVNIAPYGIFIELGLSEDMYYDYEISGTH